MDFARLMRPYKPPAWSRPTARQSMERAPVHAGRTASHLDDHLLAQIGNGDAVAFRRLIDRHLPWAYGLAFRILGDVQMADTLAQGALGDVWVDNARYRQDRRGFWVALCATVIELCRAYELLNEPALPKPANDDGTYTNEALELAMASLPWTERVALILSYHEQAGEQDIAAILGQSLPEIEALLTTARRSLLEALAPTPTLAALAIAEVR